MRKGEYVFLLLCTILVYIAIHVSLGCCREVEAGYFKLQNVSFFVKIGTRHGFRMECKKRFLVTMKNMFPKFLNDVVPSK